MSRGDRRRDARRRREGTAGGPGGRPAALAGERATDAPAPAGPTSPEPTSVVPATPTGPTGRWALVVGFGAIAVLFVFAGALRLWDLPLAPFHNDEGVNGWFVTQLLRTGHWTYDPANYHGPTFFYAAALSGLLVGLGDASMRLVPAFFGLATLGLVLLTGRWIGRVGAFAAAALLAVSPGMVFFSRYAIHEMLLVFFTLAFVLAAARWWETGRTRLLLAAAAALAGMFTTKETAIVTVVVLGLAAACVALYERMAHRVLGRRTRFAPGPGAPSEGGVPGPAPGTSRPGASRARQTDLVARFGGRDGLRRSLAAAAVVFVAIWVTLFSSLFTNLPAGVLDSFRSLTIWTQTSGATQVSGPLTYAGWMVEQELAVFVLGLGGAAWAAWEGRSRAAIFCAAWATGLFLAFSLIGYKTPWLMLGWLVPFAIVAGHVLGRAWEGRRLAARLGAPVVLGVALVLGAVQAAALAFRDYDVEENAYVYVQTRREAKDLVAWLDAEDVRRGTGGQLGIVVMSPDYWPLPWYLRDDTKAGFYSKVVDVAAPIQIVKLDQLESLPAGFADRYREHARYSMRPGVDLVVFVAVEP